jgi:hypothetical protein
LFVELEHLVVSSCHVCPVLPAGRLLYRNIHRYISCCRTSECRRVTTCATLSIQLRLESNLCHAWDSLTVSPAAKTRRQPRPTQHSRPAPSTSPLTVTQTRKASAEHGSQYQSFHHPLAKSRLAFACIIRTRCLTSRSADASQCIAISRAYPELALHV